MEIAAREVGAVQSSSTALIHTGTLKHNVQYISKVSDPHKKNEDPDPGSNIICNVWKKEQLYTFLNLFFDLVIFF